MRIISYRFFLPERHKEEVSCSGVLFDNIYQAPAITLPDQDARTFRDIIEKIKTEIQQPALAT